MPQPSLLLTGQPFVPGPLLTRSWEGAIAGWIVVCGATAAEVLAGLVTNHMATAIAAPVLAFPLVVAAGFAVVQWWQMHSPEAELASWWHLTGIAAGLLIWLVYPTTPDLLKPARTAQETCFFLQAHVTQGCLRDAADAMHHRALVWWLTGAVILGAAAMTRRSRIAAWAAIPVALGGCLLVSHFLQLLMFRYPN